MWLWKPCFHLAVQRAVGGKTAMIVAPALRLHDAQRQSEPKPDAHPYKTKTKHAVVGVGGSPFNGLRESLLHEE